MLFFDRRTVRRIRNNSRLAQIDRRLIGIRAKLALHIRKTATEKLKLLVVHVVVIRHLEDFFRGKSLFGAHVLISCEFSPDPSGFVVEPPRRINCERWET